jgi:hypothetical protein
MTPPNPSLFCSLGNCLLMTEWMAFWQIAGVTIALIGGAAGIKKIHEDLKQLANQRKKEQLDREIAAKLKRTEFFLNQHRRLFDDKDLSEVLSLLDDDNEILAEHKMWDKNRKFLTFIEEIALLIGAEHINSDVAYYMFGHYARCARDGKNFNAGINSSEEHWRVFQKFCSESDKYFSKFISSGEVPEL